MGLERWDSRRRKYILYDTAVQQSSDCSGLPFERIPRRVFLDTNVINLLVKFSEEVFDFVDISARLESTLALDVEALRHIFFVGQRANWSVFGSLKTLEELSQTGDLDLRRRLLGYGMEVIDRDFNDEDWKYGVNLGRKLRDSHFLSALPDLADRELVGNAIGLGCDAFCTCDRKTIVKKHRQLKLLPVRVLTPGEWWAHIKPWAALWS
jgi:hypothetical protein